MHAPIAPAEGGQTAEELRYGQRAPIAQLVEQLPLKEMVGGSNPSGRTRILQTRFRQIQARVCQICLSQSAGVVK